MKLTLKLLIPRWDLSERPFLSLSPMLKPESALILQPWFHGTKDCYEAPWPKRYEVFPEPLPPRSVRALVIPLEGAAASLAAAGEEVIGEILNILPPSVKTFSNIRT